ncbi:MAG TPA: VCBS repeat-containing protein [Thermoanaerobaculia bacterium]|nr:VCBS repeat-containing protein [Thermoanaerobaculia bacterium]
MSIRIVVACLISAVLATSLSAQPSSVEREMAREAAAKEGPIPKYIRDETPEQRKARLATTEDPGLDPDPERIWWRLGHAYKIEKYDRHWAAYDREVGYVRPLAMANFAFEIYQQNDKFVWVWMPQLPEPGSANAMTGDAPAERVTPYTPPQIAYLKMIVPEYEPLSVPAAGKKITFRPSSNGLPQTGSWRNSLDVADMNGDGHLDIITPPQRGGAGTIPAIFLGDGKGNWTPWDSVIWPYEIQYGSVAAGDFNNDKKMDLVFGIHLVGLRVFLGDGKGNFVDGSAGLEAGDFTTRRVTTADVDRDGNLDIVTIYEGPAPGRQAKFRGGKLRVYLNENKGTRWRAVDVAGPTDYVGGDWVAVGKFNDDKYPDFVGSSNFFQGTDLLYRSKGREKWDKVDGRDGELIPFLSIYTAVTAARLSSKRYDDAVISYQRSWPDNIDPSIVPTPSLSMVTGIDRIAFDGKAPRRVPIVRHDSRGQITGLASADFDGDGNQDLIYMKSDPREFVILLGDGKGGFKQAAIEGLNAEMKPSYDIKVADVNQDGRPDVLVMYESTAMSSLGLQDGSIQVFLNQGVSAEKEMTAAAK